MRYALLTPADATTLDPRGRVFGSMESLNATFTLHGEYHLEQEAAEEAMETYPNGMAMPVPVKVGSGTIWMLGIIENISVARDPDAEIPFVMFVHAIAEREREKARITTHQHWNRKLWKPPVLKPMGISVVTPVELRATDLDQPSLLDARFGMMADGRAVLYCELNGVEMSIVFNEPGVRLFKPSGG